MSSFIDIVYRMSSARQATVRKYIIFYFFKQNPTVCFLPISALVFDGEDDRECGSPWRSSGFGKEIG